MPQFAPGEVKTAKVAMRNPTAKAFDYNGFIYMGTDLAVVSEKAFRLLAGEEKQVSFPVSMPTTPGVYPVHIGVFSEGANIVLYRAVEDVEIISGVAKFIYASDVKQTLYHQPNYPAWAEGLEISVDIKNTGSGAGTCTPIWYVETCYGYHTVGLGQQIVNPGETATFSGRWYWPYGPMEPDEWWRPGFIISGAGPISLAFGRSLYLVSVDIPSQIISGSKYLATQTIHLPYAADSLFRVELCLTPTRRSVASSALIGAVTYANIILTATKDYEVKGVYTDRVSYPAEAIDWDYWNRPFPLPRGTYNVVSSVYHWYATNEYMTAGYGWIWENYIVGQVQVV